MKICLFSLPAMNDPKHFIFFFTLGTEMKSQCVWEKNICKTRFYCWYFKLCCIFYVSDMACWIVEKFIFILHSTSSRYNMVPSIAGCLVPIMHHFLSTRGKCCCLSSPLSSILSLMHGQWPFQDMTSQNLSSFQPSKGAETRISQKTLQNKSVLIIGIIISVNCTAWFSLLSVTSKLHVYVEDADL